MDKTARFLQILAAVVEADSAVQNFGPVIHGDMEDTRMEEYLAIREIFDDFCVEELPPDCLAAVREFWALVEKRDVYGNRSKLFKEYLDIADK
jgi:hypothetical protein